MNKLSRTIPLDQATVGMVLAAAVRQTDGSMLLPEGFELGETQLASLHKRGIQEISVTAPASAEQPAEAEGQRQAREDAARAAVRRLFRKSETDATTQALFRAVLEYRVEKLQ